MSHVVGGVSGARRIFGIWVSLERPRGLEGHLALSDPQRDPQQAAPD